MARVAMLAISAERGAVFVPARFNLSDRMLREQRIFQIELASPARRKGPSTALDDRS